MELWEFHELAAQTIERFKPRVPAQFAEGLGYPIEGGEYGMAVEDLISIVVDGRTPVAPDERETLYRLARFMPKNEELLAKLEHLTLEEADSRLARSLRSRK